MFNQNLEQLAENIKKMLDKPQPYLSKTFAETLVKMPQENWAFCTNFTTLLTQVPFTKEHQKTIIKSFLMCETPLPLYRLSEKSAQTKTSLDIDVVMDFVEEATQKKDYKSQDILIGAMGLGWHDEKPLISLTSNHHFKDKQSQLERMKALLDEQVRLKQRMDQWGRIAVIGGGRNIETFSTAYVSMISQTLMLTNYVLLHGDEKEKEKALQQFYRIAQSARSVKINKVSQTTMHESIHPYFERLVKSNQLQEGFALADQIKQALPHFQKDRMWKTVAQSFVGGYTINHKIIENLFELHRREPGCFKSSDFKKMINIYYNSFSEVELLKFWNELSQQEQPAFLKSLIRENPGAFEGMAKALPPEMIVQALNDFFESKIRHLPTCKSIWERHILMEKAQVEQKEETSQAKRRKM